MMTSLSAFLQWKVNIFMYRNLGWKVASFYLQTLGMLYFFLKKSERLKIETAIKEVFGRQKNSREIQRIIKKVFRGILSHYYEKLFNVYASSEDSRTFLTKRVKGKGVGSIYRELSKGNGLVLITGHIGGVEYIPGYLSVLNCRPAIVARFSSDHFREQSHQKAAQFSIQIIDADLTPNIARAIFHALERNRIVVTLCDEFDEWRPSHRHKLRFLGKEIGLDRTLNILLRRCNASVVFGIMHRKKRQQYHFKVYSLNEMAAKVRNLGDTSIGEGVLRLLEQYIYKYPEQWYQWKKYPDVGTPIPADSVSRKATKTIFTRPAFHRIP
jgi:lauroyl/myristoyl acyltransferase